MTVRVLDDAEPVADKPVVFRVAQGEINKQMYGLRRRPGQVRERLAREFLVRVEVLPWTESVAECYGALRPDLSSRGITLGPLDMQIAAHAKAEKCVLVTDDKAFGQVPELAIVNWLA